MGILNSIFKKKTETSDEENGNISTKEPKEFMQCPDNKHSFIEADAYTGGTMYKCDKCGLEAHAPMFSGEIFNKYFGSYIVGISHVWDSTDMDANKIVDFAIRFGDLPIVTVKYDGTVMKIKNAINGSRDGWMQFPENYFEEKMIKLSDQDKNKLKECLSSIDFSTFVTSQELFKNFGAPGFCIRNRFLCRFFNGKGFECLEPEASDFEKLVSVVRNIVGLREEFVDEDVSREITTPGVIVSCCSKKVPDFYKYCPYCGKPIDEKSEKCSVLYDDQATIWICTECAHSNQLENKFCGNCGSKSPW